LCLINISFICTGLVWSAKLQNGKKIPNKLHNRMSEIFEFQTKNKEGG